MDLLINGLAIPERAIHAARAADCFGGKPDAVFLSLDAGTIRAREIVADDPVTADGAEYYAAEAEESGTDTEITAVSVRGGGTSREWAVYNAITLGELIEAVGRETGMETKAVGIDTDIFYRRIVRRDETAAEMLARVLTYEDAALKAERGTLYAVSWETIENSEATMNLEIDTLTGGSYRRTRTGCGRVIVASAYGDGDAVSDIVPRELCEKIGGLEVFSTGQAQRWAYGILRSRNRENEELRLQLTADRRIFAGCKLHLDGIGLTGDWIVTACDRDLTDEKTAVCAVRCRQNV